MKILGDILKIYEAKKQLIKVEIIQIEKELYWNSKLADLLPEMKKIQRKSHQ